MNVLLIGSGGREHALAWKISQSAELNKLYIAPGNAGTESFGQNVSLNIEDINEVSHFIETHAVDMVIVGPEVPLVNGLHDAILNSDLINKPIVIGPQSRGAMLEGSKKFAKEFMIRHDIPTARYQSFDKSNISEAKEFLNTLESPFVLKADGLAAGKGVLIIEDREKAYLALKDIIEGQQFGVAGDEVVIEEFLHGVELSVFVFTDGRNYKILPTAKDYKRIGEGDEGLNTGGMGALSPAPSATTEFMDKVKQQVIIPTIDGLQSDEIDYQGFIFIGLMVVNGEPFVIEYNVRLGDPETEVILPRIDSDLLAMMSSVRDQSLHNYSLKISPKSACTVMMVSGGYPSSYKKGYAISGIDHFANAINDETLLFQAGSINKNGVVVTNGGRVMALTCLSDAMLDSLDNVYDQITKLKFDNAYYRKDIGYELRMKTKSND